MRHSSHLRTTTHFIFPCLVEPDPRSVARIANCETLLLLTNLPAPTHSQSSLLSQSLPFKTLYHPPRSPLRYIWLSSCSAKRSPEPCSSASLTPSSPTASRPWCPNTRLPSIHRPLSMLAPRDSGQWSQGRSCRACWWRMRSVLIVFFTWRLERRWPILLLACSWDLRILEKRIAFRKLRFRLDVE
jgi:hypothetical protein